MSRVPSTRELATFLDVTEGAVRKMRSSDKERYNREVERYLASRKRVLATYNLKGGVGKSTIANALATQLEGAVVLNVDHGQTAERFNRAPTYNFADLLEEEPALTLEEAVDALFGEYDTVIIDTPGHFTEEISQMFGFVDDYIIPFVYSPRDMQTTLETGFELAFGADALTGEGPKRVAFVNTRHTGPEQFNQAVEAMQRTVEAYPMGREVVYEFFSFPFTSVIPTLEERRMSIEELARENPFPYRVARRRFRDLSGGLAKFFGLSEWREAVRPGGAR